MWLEAKPHAVCDYTRTPRDVLLAIKEWKKAAVNTLLGIT